jgi:2-dehydro-3-deoxygluconokinase
MLSDCNRILMENPPAGRVVCFGEVMLRYSVANGVEMTSPGGCEYNVACALAAIGTKVAWVSNLPSSGVDGEVFRELLSPAEAAGVWTGGIVRNSERLIGRYRVDNDDKSVVYNRENSAFAHLEPSDFHWRELLSGARWLVLSGITPLLGEKPLAAWSQAMTFAELDGTRIALDLNHRPALGSLKDVWSIISPRIRMLHVLVLSHDSLSGIAVLEGMPKPETYEEAIGTLTELRRRWLIPHLCCCFKRPEGESAKQVPLQRRWSVVSHAFGTDSTELDAIVHSLVEPLGGGDAWLAGFLDGLMEYGQGPASALLAAMRGDALAGLAQQTRGDIADVSRVNLDEIEENRLNSNGLDRIVFIG